MRRKRICIMIFSMMLLNGCSMFSSYWDAQVLGWRDAYIGKEMGESIVKDKYKGECKESYNRGYALGEYDRHNTYKILGSERNDIFNGYLVGLIDGYYGFGRTPSFSLCEKYPKGYADGEEARKNRNIPKQLIELGYRRPFSSYPIYPWYPCYPYHRHYYYYP